VRKELAVMTKATHIGLYAKRDFQVRAAKRNAEFVKKHLVELA
jgi:hypothetical protein